MAQTRVKLVAQLPGHSGPAWCVAWNPARPLLASCSSDKTVRIYTYSNDARTDELTFRFLVEIPTAHKRTIRSIAWSPNGKSLATGSFDSTVGVWEQVDENEGIEGIETFPGDGEAGSSEKEEEREWECITTLEGHDSECKSVGWSSDGMLIGSCSRDKSVWIWELQDDGDFECISVMMEHTQDVKQLAWHPHEEILASASYDAYIFLFYDDPDSDWCLFQKLKPSLPCKPATSSSTTSTASTKADLGFSIPPLQDPETVWSLAFSPCGKYLASGGDGGGIRLWARTGTNTDSRWEEVVHTEAHNPRACFSLSWSEDERMEETALGRLVSVGGDGRICIWNVNKTAPTDPTKPSKPSLELMSSLSQAHTIYDINSVALFKRQSGTGKKSLSDERIKRLESSVFATAGDDGEVKVWQVV